MNAIQASPPPFLQVMRSPPLWIQKPDKRGPYTENTSPAHAICLVSLTSYQASLSSLYWMLK